MHIYGSELPKQEPASPAYGGAASGYQIFSDHLPHLQAVYKIQGCTNPTSYGTSQKSSLAVRASSSLGLYSPARPELYKLHQPTRQPRLNLGKLILLLLGSHVQQVEARCRMVSSWRRSGFGGARRSRNGGGLGGSQWGREGGRGGSSSSGSFCGQGTNVAAGITQGAFFRSRRSIKWAFFLTGLQKAQAAPRAGAGRPLAGCRQRAAGCEIKISLHRETRIFYSILTLSFHDKTRF